MTKKNLWKSYSQDEYVKLEQVNNAYKQYLNFGKTERECIKATIQLAQKAGYRDLQEIIKGKEPLKVGDKVYSVCMEKTIVLFQIGKENIETGLNILGAHIDSPRIDVKQNPLYEAGEFAYLDTHYYGGIKKYQWVALPLAIHGVVVRKDGTKQEIVIGEKDEEPIFVITDLLVHLSAEQMENKADKVIEGEKLDLIVGNKPMKGIEKEAVKENILELLKKMYDIEEDDFISAELEIVPAGKAKDCGIDMLWSSFFVTLRPNFLPQGLYNPVACLVRRFVVIIRMRTYMIILYIRKFFDCCVEFFLCVIIMLINKIIFQCIEISFHRSIIIWISSLTHALSNTKILTKSCELF